MYHYGRRWGCICQMLGERVSPYDPPCDKFVPRDRNVMSRAPKSILEALKWT